jgi:glutamate synthase (ferredoxin)
MSAVIHVMLYVLQDPIRWRHLSDVDDGYSPTLPHLKGLQNGDTATSAIKQVIDGLFCFS